LIAIDILYRLACFIGLRFPLPLAYFIACRLTDIRYLCFSGARKTCWKNFRVVLRHRAALTGEVFDEQRLRLTVRAAYHNFARYITDFIRTPKWNRQTVRRRVTVENLEYLQAALDRQKGVIVLTAHLGNWELAGIATSLLGFPLHAIALPHRMAYASKAFLRRRQSKGVKVILAGDYTRQVLKAIRQKEVVAVLGDRLFTEKGTRTVFMGRTAAMPRGPATLAVKTGAEMLVGFLVMEGSRYRLFFERMPQPPQDLSEDGRISFLMDAGVKIMEKNILRFPSQWLCFSPVWPEEF
jgi:KDO2-lipid IV(A) lauroyltransferase